MARVRSEPFDELVARLHTIGAGTAAAEVEAALEGVWTSSSEMIGELGAAVQRARKMAGRQPADVAMLFEACLAEVRKVWPGMR